MEEILLCRLQRCPAQQSGAALREPADLRHHTLIYEAVDGIPDYTTWDRWLQR
jgi:LysR family glycine cleavage system transcriptional activator